jgi:hypothetical protein
MTLEPAVRSSTGGSRSSREPSPSESFARRSLPVDRLVSQVRRRPGRLRGRQVRQVRPRHPCDWVYGGQGVAYRDPRSGRRIPSQARLGPRQGGRAQRRLERHGYRWPVGHGGHLWMGALPLQGRREPDQGQLGGRRGQAVHRVKSGRRRVTYLRIYVAASYHNSEISFVPERGALLSLSSWWKLDFRLSHPAARVKQQAWCLSRRGQ